MILNRKDWYSSELILHNIAPQLRYRYLSVRKKSKKENQKWILSRYYQGYSLDLLKDALKRNNVLEDSSAKIYFDLSTWKNGEGVTPIFSFDKKKRLEQKEEFTKGEGWKNQIKEHSFAIDIDNKNLKKSWKDAKKIKEVFDIYKLPYSLSFSGEKGFHLIIDSEWIKTRVNPINRADLFGKVVQNLANDENCKSVDFSIYDCRRIIKLRYSLNFKDGKEYVVLPLDNQQFENWKLEDMELTNVMRNVRLFKRRILTRTHNLTKEELINNVTKFIKEYK